MKSRPWEDEINRWLDWCEGQRSVLDYGRLPKHPRRAAVILFPITLPLYCAWFLLWVFVFCAGVPFAYAIKLWGED